MKIIPINLFNTHKADFKNNYSNNYSYLGNVVPKDSVRFTGAMGAKRFSVICKDAPDLYTAGSMLTHNHLNKMKERALFKGPISEVVRKLNPYKEKFLTFELRPEFDGVIPNIELEIFEKIEKAAKQSPDMDLPSLFKQWYGEAYSALRKTQRPHIDRINTLGAQLPQHKLEQFYNFMLNTDRQLYGNPIHRRFSTKEFVYQVEKILEKLPEGAGFKSSVKHQLGILQKSCLNNDKPMTDSVIKEVFKAPRTDSKHINNLGEESLRQLRWKKSAARVNIIEEIKELAGKNGYKKLERLCDSSIKMVKGEETQVPFSNKAFAYDLGKILEDVPDKKLVEEIMNEATSLPNSSKSTDAFIIKLSDADADTIGDRIFSPALKSIEHIVPASEGGETTMANCALARKGLNTLRGNAPLWTFLRYFPLKNQQKYVLYIVKQNNKGKIPIDDAMEHIINLEKEGHLDFSSYKAMLKDVPAPLRKIKQVKNPKN